MLFGKGSKVYSIFRLKCPRCHEGDLFRHGNAYHLRKMGDMHECCPRCGLKYQMEPSFYYGAMYVSYGYTVAIFVAVYIISGWIYDPGVWDVVITLTVVLAAMAPWLFRISRATWINLFVRYAPEKRDQ